VSRGRSHLEVAEAAIRGGADVIQLRDKTASSGTLYRVALAMRKLTREAKVPLIINDRLDIALAVDADGVHVGQQDLPASVVRKLLGPGKILGVSAETPQEALLAEKDGADYLAWGRSSRPRDEGGRGEPRDPDDRADPPRVPSARGGDRRDQGGECPERPRGGRGRRRGHFGDRRGGRYRAGRREMKQLLGDGG